MPNHCENELRISGPKAELDRFRALPFQAGTFVPYPAAFQEKDRIAAEYAEAHKDDPNAFRDAPKDGFNSGGYEWCVAHWGTKWGMYEVEERHNAKRLRYDFHSAWSPPIPVIEAASMQFPALTFELKYFEAGEAFQGVFTVQGGDVLTNESMEYHGTRGG